MDWAQRVLVSGITSHYWPDTGGVLQGSVSGAVLFSVFISDLDAGINCTLSMFADYTKLGGAVDSLDGKETLQRDLARLDSWGITNHTKFNKNKRSVLYLGWSSPGYMYKLKDKRLKSSTIERDLGIWVDGNLNMSQQCDLRVKRASCVLGCTKHNTTSGLGR